MKFEKLHTPAVSSIVENTLKNMDDGELFLEYCQSESLVFDDGKLKNASFDISQGFGLRAVLGEITGYAHSTDLSEEAIKRASDTVKAVSSGYDGIVNLDTTPIVTPHALYTENNPINEIEFADKVKLLQEIDAYLRAKNPLVKQVSVSLSAEWQVVEIIRADMDISDIRPLVRLDISVVVEKNGRMEKGGYGTGGRTSYKQYLPNWKSFADEALRRAFVNLEAIPAPAGNMPVVLGNGWTGVLLHEAVGHGLEGDFNRKKTSAFSGLIGERVASKGVTVVDNGTMENRRGSLSVDDEGTPTQCTTLIEDGILKGYIQDRMNARLMGVASTGNGRREGFDCPPIPRMTNTYMLNGDKAPEEIIASVDKGIYAANFGGGQVDITSGKFVFSASEAYLIEDGKVTTPIKGATLIGNGADVMQKVALIGNDMKLDAGVGTCGKAGQGVPVGVGQPTMLVSEMTVGGTEV